MTGIDIGTAAGASQYIREWGDLGGFEGRLLRALQGLAMMRGIDVTYRRDTTEVDGAIAVMQAEQVRRGFTITTIFGHKVNVAHALQEESP